MATAKAMLVLHGKQAANELVREAVLARREAGWQLDVRVTWEQDDLARFVAEALAGDYLTLIAGGGDGTLGSVAALLAAAPRRLSLALLPLGTANDFAVAAGIPLEPASALALLDAPAVPVDMGRMNEHFFLNMATGGFGSRVTANTPEELKKALGGVAYLLSGLSQLGEVTAVQGRFRGPDFVWEGPFLAFGVGNGRQAGGGQQLCPQARIDDGLLDLCIVPAAEGAVGTLGTVIAGGLRGIEAVGESTRLPWVELEVDEGLDLNLDGEPWVERRMRFSVSPGALNLHLPADSPLLGVSIDARQASPRAAGEA